MKGLKTGGRLPGTPNKKSLEVRELIAKTYPDYHPLLALCEIAVDKNNDVALRLQANKEVAKYVCPQLKTITLVEDDPEVVIRVIRE
jgi:hypothetical protein